MADVGSPVGGPPASAGGQTPGTHPTAVEVLSGWDKVWTIVLPDFQELSSEAILKSHEGRTGVTFNSGVLSTQKEQRGVAANLTMTPPGAVSLEGDHVSMERAEKAGRYYFWDKEKDMAWAPKQWPRNCNIPIALFTPELPEKMKFRRTGSDYIVMAFWWAFSEARARCTKKTSVENQNAVFSFKQLCRNALFDYKVFASEEEIMLDTIQQLDAIEEQREQNGFTG